MNENKKYLINWKAFIASFIAVFVLFVDTQMSGNLSEDIHGAGMSQFILFIILFKIYKKYFNHTWTIDCDKRKKIIISSIVASAIMTSIVIVDRGNIAHQDLKYSIMAMTMVPTALYSFYTLFKISINRWYDEKIRKGMFGRHGLYIVISVVTTFALFLNTSKSNDIIFNMRGTEVSQIVVFMILVQLVSAYFEGMIIDLSVISKRNSIFYFMISVLFTIFAMIGRWQESAIGNQYLYCLIPVLVGLTCIFYIMLSCIVENMNRVACNKDSCLGITRVIFEEHNFLIPFLIILGFRLPYLIAFFPCTISWDGAIQIANFYGRELFTNHHPPFLSFFYGGIVWLAHETGFDNIGTFVISLIQTMLSAIAGAKVCQLFQKMKTPYHVRWISLAFYCIYTVWGIFGMTIIKDGIYYPFVMLFTVKIVECILNQGEFFKNKKNLILMMLYAVLMAETRPNGLHVFVITLVFLIVVVATRKSKLVLGCFAVGSVVIVMMLESVVYPKLGVIKLDDMFEPYSLLLQQTAKYARDYPEDVTDEEYAVLNQLFEYDKVGEAYNKRHSDWVKNCIRIQEGVPEDPTNRAFADIKDDYLKVWFAQLMRHPWSYIETFFECTYGYYYLDNKVYMDGYGFYEIWYGVITENMINLSFIPSLASMRFLLEMTTKMEYMPCIGITYRVGIYTWIVFAVMLLLCMKKRYKELVATLPAFLNILVCLLSPVNANIRYPMPTMCIVPIVIALLYYCICDKQMEN